MNTQHPTTSFRLLLGTPITYIIESLDLTVLYVLQRNPKGLLPIACVDKINEITKRTTAARN